MTNLNPSNLQVHVCLSALKRQSSSASLIIEPIRDKTNKVTVTQRRLKSASASAQSDQSLLCAQWVAKEPSHLHADSEDTDQTGRMPRLI